MEESMSFHRLYELYYQYKRDYLIIKSDPVESQQGKLYYRYKLYYENKIADPKIKNNIHHQ